MEKRPLREHDEMIENAIWDDIVWELNQKLVQECGIRNFYSKHRLILVLKDRINKTSEVFEGGKLADRAPTERDKIVLVAKKD